MMHPGGDVNARRRTQDFLTFATAAEEGLSYIAAKELIGCSSNQAETRKSLFEELGLLFVPYRSNRIILTPLGKQLADLMPDRDLSKVTDVIARQATALLIWAQCRAQINRPQSRGGPKPSEADWKSCDVKPYATAWLAAKDLDGILFLHEFMGVLRRLHETKNYSDAISRILDARKSGELLADSSAWTGRALEMNYVIYWKSHLSVAQKLMDVDQERGALVAKKDVWDIVDAAIKFQSGCGGDKISGITASSWSDAEDYFLNHAGAACPPFLASGSPKLTTFGGQALVDLSTYEITKQGQVSVVTGGPELCSLPIKMPCYHSASPTRLMRIDGKNELSTGIIRIELGLGRPISDLILLRKAIGSSNG